MIALTAYGVRQTRKAYKKHKAAKEAQKSDRPDIVDPSTELISPSLSSSSSVFSQQNIRSATPQSPCAGQAHPHHIADTLSHSSSGRSNNSHSAYTASVYSQSSNHSPADDMRQYQQYIERQSQGFHQHSDFDAPPTYEQIRLSSPRQHTTSGWRTGYLHQHYCNGSCGGACNPGGNETGLVRSTTPQPCQKGLQPSHPTAPAEGHAASPQDWPYWLRAQQHYPYPPFEHAPMQQVPPYRQRSPPSPQPRVVEVPDTGSYRNPTYLEPMSAVSELPDTGTYRSTFSASGSEPLSAVSELSTEMEQPPRSIKTPQPPRTAGHASNDDTFTFDGQRSSLRRKREESSSSSSGGGGSEADRESLHNRDLAKQFDIHT